MKLRSAVAAVTLSLNFTVAPSALAYGGTPCGKCAKQLSGLINLPADDTVHPYTPASIEWWYWTSHLEAEDGRRFGFLNIVYTSLYEVAPGSVGPLQWSDTTISDISEGKYHFPGRVFLPEPAVTVPNGFEFDIGQNHVAGGDGHDVVHTVVDDGTKRYVVDLELNSEKAPVQHMAGGYIYEYGRTRMDTRGTITINGEKLKVHGHSYFDHEYGDQLYVMATVKDWTWISVLLDNDSELVLLVLNHKDGTKIAWADLTDAQCRTTRYNPGEFTLAATGTWAQSDTCRYPMGWTISIPRASVYLQVASSIVDQDIFVPGMDHYYEGEATVSGWDHGPVDGHAVVELTAFCGY